VDFPDAVANQGRRRRYSPKNQTPPCRSPTNVSTA
jgi:hypothetical protein